MLHELKEYEPLSQVWFVHDYIQLQFQDRTISILNKPTIDLATGKSIHRDTQGFCDALVAQIGQPIDDAVHEEGESFMLVFGNHVKLTVPLRGEDASGPEAVEIGLYIIFN